MPGSKWSLHLSVTGSHCLMTSALASGSCLRAIQNTSVAASPSTACAPTLLGNMRVCTSAWHLIGLEVGISVASVGLRREPTGCPTGFRADAVATAKRDLTPGEILDGEGVKHGGRLVDACCGRTQTWDPAARPGARLETHQTVARVNQYAGRMAVDEANSAVQVRREMEQMFTPQPVAGG